MKLSNHRGIKKTKRTLNGKQREMENRKGIDEGRIHNIHKMKQNTPKYKMRKHKTRMWLLRKEGARQSQQTGMGNSRRMDK